MSKLMTEGLSDIWIEKRTGDRRIALLNCPVLHIGIELIQVP